MVSGTGGRLRTAATGVMETDNYPHGGSVEVTAAADYPTTLNPAETIQEINVTQNHPSIVIELHTTGGSTFEAFHGGTTGSRDKFETDKIVLKDPDGTGETVSFDWAGE
jgi:hypothetical protein